MIKKTGFPVERSKPDTAIRIFTKGKHLIVRQAIRGVIVDKRLAVEPTDAHVRSQPDIALAVLENGINIIGRQPFVDLVVFNKRLLSVTIASHADQQEYKKLFMPHTDGEDRGITRHSDCAESMKALAKSIERDVMRGLTTRSPVVP